MSQSFLVAHKDETQVRAWLFQGTVDVKQEKEDLWKAQRQLRNEQMELERAKRDFLLEKKMSEEWILRQQLLFEQKWKILEGEMHDFACEKEKMKQQQQSQTELSVDVNCYFFRGISNRLTLKKRYKDLIKIYHPDNLAGDTFAIQEINKQYEELQQQL